MATQMLPSVRDLHAEQEDHIKKINRYLAGLLDHSDDWSISEVSFCFGNDWNLLAPLPAKICDLCGKVAKAKVLPYLEA
jgi:hypothetical protein